MERFLYFVKTTDAPDANGEVALYPTSSLTSIEPSSSSTARTVLRFVPRDGTVTTEDSVTLDHADGDHKKVFNGVVALVNAQKNKDPFVVAADDQNSIYNIDGVTGVNTISSVD